LGFWDLWKTTAAQRLRSYSNRLNDYHFYIAAPPDAPMRWSRISQMTEETVVLDDGTPVPLRAVNALLVAYANGQILEVYGGKELPLPSGITGLNPGFTTRKHQLHLEELKNGESFVRVRYSATTQMAKRPGDYTTTLTNVGTEPVRILKFAGYTQRGGIWRLSTVTGDFYSDTEFRAWYGMEDRVWLDPGECAADPNNYGAPPVLWAYFGETESRIRFIAGAVLERRL